MPRFVSKPEVVDAQQWFPPGDARHVPSMLSHRKGNQVDPPDYRQKGDLFCFAEGASPGMGGDTYFIRVGGLNDNLQVHPGDWIITSANGEKVPCRPDVFEASYERIQPPPQNPPKPPMPNMFG